MPLMVDLLIRNLEPQLERELRQRARASGKSLSEAAQDLLRKGLIAPRLEYGLGTKLRNMLGPDGFVDLDIPRDMKDRPPPDLS
jgi:plasmid stability protein